MKDSTLGMLITRGLNSYPVPPKAASFKLAGHFEICFLATESIEPLKIAFVPCNRSI